MAAVENVRTFGGHFVSPLQAARSFLSQGVWVGGPPGHFLGATPVEVKTSFSAEKGRFLLRREGPASTGVAHSLVSGGDPTHTFLFQHLEFWPKHRVLTRGRSGGTGATLSNAKQG